MLDENKIKSLQQMVGALTQEELLWMNGYINCMITKTPATETAPALKPAISKITITYGTETGNSKKVATDFAAKAKKIDPGLSTAILAEQSKQIKQFEQLGSRLLRTEKQTQETNLKRIQRLKEKLFPEGGLQERHENFLTFFSNYGPKWIEELITICDPWVGQFLVLEMKDPQPS